MDLPWYYETTEFWLKFLDSRVPWSLNSENISKALNTADLTYLCNMDVINHISRIFDRGYYSVAFRTIHPHWFEGSDNSNYFNAQHYLFGNRSVRECPLDGGFYQCFWKDPSWTVERPLIGWKEKSGIGIAPVPVGMFEMIVPLQLKKNLDRSRIEYYKESIMKGNIPTVLALGFVDDRKTVSFADRLNHIPKMYPKYDHLCTIVSWIIDGHHKMAAAAEVNSPIRFLQYIRHNPYKRRRIRNRVRFLNLSGIDYSP